jgi:hypothetical protein
LGKFWTKPDRKRQLERERAKKAQLEQRRTQIKEMIANTDPQPTIVKLSHRKMAQSREQQVKAHTQIKSVKFQIFDRFVTVRELFSVAHRDPQRPTYANNILSVTTV